LHEHGCLLHEKRLDEVIEEEWCAVLELASSSSVAVGDDL